MKPRALKISVFVLIMLWAMTSCSTSAFNTAIVHLPTPNPSPIVVASPEIIMHSPPHLIANTQVLKDAGCTNDQQVSYMWNCESNPQLKSLGCDEVYPQDLLAGLIPGYPVMGCSSINREPPNKWRFYEAGCLVSGYVSKVLFKDGRYQLITDESELQSTFAPIESADEALGYAIVATNLEADYEDEDYQHYWDEYKFFVKKYEETHVEETSEGYVVHLFTMPTPLCGCQIHTTYLVDILVTKDGKIRQLNAMEAYAVDGCID